MKILTIARTAALGLAVTSLLAGPAGAADRMPKGSRSKHVEKRIEVAGRQVSLETVAAQIDARPTEGDELVLVADLEYWSNDEEWMDAVEQAFEVTVRESNNRIELGLTRFPEEEKGWFKKIFKQRNVHYSLEVVLEVPSGTELELDNRYGDIDVAEIGGALNVRNVSGKVVASDVVGRAAIENRYGDTRIDNVDGDLDLTVTSGRVDVEGVTGSAVVKTQYGDVEIRGIDGSLDLESRSGSIEVERIGDSLRLIGSYGDTVVEGAGGAVEIEITSGNVSLRDAGATAKVRASYGTIEIAGVGEWLNVVSKSGKVMAENVGASADIENSYGSVDLRDIRGSVSVRNPNGAVTLEDVTGNASVESSYASVRARRLGGALQVSAKSSAVSAIEVGGGVEVVTSYAGVIVNGAGGPIDVRNQSGRVDVKGLRDGALTAQHRIETSYAGVDFDWPAGAPMTYSLESTYGSLSIAFPSSVEESGSRRTAEGRVGTDGGSAASVTISTRSGGVRLGRE